MIMKCRFKTRDNRCAGKYEGFACIQKQCACFAEAQNCEHHETTGDYCRKYGRFGCVGKDSCGSLVDYLEAVAADAESCCS